MSEDPIAQREIAALTRRYENALAIVRGDIAALDNRVIRIEEKLTEVLANQESADTLLHSIEDQLGEFIATQQTANAQILEMLAALSTKRAD